MQNQVSTIFYDGVTSDVKNVQLVMHNKHLEIIDPTNSQSIEWDYENIKIEETPYDERAGVISHKTAPHARLHVDRENFVKIKQRIPKSKSNALRLFLMILVMLAAIIGLVFFAIPALAPIILPQIPTKWDKKIGDYAAHYFIEKENICYTPEGDAALQKIADKISNENFDYELSFVVQNSETVNAFALPGGQIVIYSQLLDQIKSQDELVGILAHEAAHVQYRHGTENMLRYILSSLVIDLFTGGSGTAVYLGYQLHNMKYSQNLEHDADTWAVKRLHSLQVKPTEFKNFFVRMQNQSKLENNDSEEIYKKLSEFISTHPSDSSRIQNISQQASDIQETQPIHKYRELLTTSEWQKIKQICN